jgi:hypothetical protein
MTGNSERIVRAECLSATPVVIQVGSSRIAATDYHFRVDEYLKGSGAEQLVFRQVGTPDGGVCDLGQLAGLPVYRVGEQYLLLLLEESRIGLTSPAGRGNGAFLLEGECVIPLHPWLPVNAQAPAKGSPIDTADAVARGLPVLYEEMRRAILEEVGP